MASLLELLYECKAQLLAGNEYYAAELMKAAIVLCYNENYCPTDLVDARIIIQEMAGRYTLPYITH